MKGKLYILGRYDTIMDYENALRLKPGDTFTIRERIIIECLKSGKDLGYIELVFASIHDREGLIEFLADSKAARRVRRSQKQECKQ